jgi:hypothetical protein
MDEQIIQCYHTKVGLKPVSRGHAPGRDLARRLNIPRWKVSRRARELGLMLTYKKEPDWSPKEIEILERGSCKGPEKIQRLLAKDGFRRSVTAIIVKRKRLQLFRADTDYYSATSLAQALGIGVPIVIRWIEKGCLVASKKGTKRTPQQGGDSWLIHHKDVRKFVVEYVSEIDFRKVDKHWLVDLLANKLAGE